MTCSSQSDTYVHTHTTHTPLCSQRSRGRERSTWTKRSRMPSLEWRKWNLWWRNRETTTRGSCPPWRRQNNRRRYCARRRWAVGTCPELHVVAEFLFQTGTSIIVVRSTTCLTLQSYTKLNGQQEITYSNSGTHWARNVCNEKYWRLSLNFKSPSSWVGETKVPDARSLNFQSIPCLV